MNRIKLFLIFPILFSILLQKKDLSSYKRAELIDQISENANGANCFCRLGNDRGYEVNNYSNSYYDFGSLKYWNNFGATRKRRSECYKLCKEKVVLWLATKSDDFLCDLANKTTPYNLVAYHKVGGSVWQRTHTERNIPCSQESASYVDPCSLSIPDRYLNFGLQIMRNGGTEFKVYASPKCRVPNGWGYHWRVCEFNLQTNQCVPNTQLSMPDHWWTPNHSCSFDGYNGSSSVDDPNARGTFIRGKTYQIIFGVYGPNQDWVETKKYFNQYRLMDSI